MKRVYGCWLIVYFTVGSGTTVALIDSRLSEEDFGGREETKGSSRQMRDLLFHGWWKENGNSKEHPEQVFLAGVVRGCLIDAIAILVQLWKKKGWALEIPYG